MSQKNTPNKNQHIQFQTNSIVTSLGSMQPQQLQNIAPAPQQQGGPMGQHTQHHQMAPPTPQPNQQQHGGQMIASSMAQIGQPLPGGQFQVLQQPSYGNAQPGGGAQFTTMQPFATYNQQGQLVLQQGSFALPQGMQLAQQPGQQQYILTAAPSQKPGQPAQMIASPAPGSQGVKSMGQMSQSYTISNTGLVRAAGGNGSTPQTFMIAANPMGGMSASPQNIQTSMGPQMKQVDQKPIIPCSTQQLLPQSPVGQIQQTSGSSTPAPNQQLMLPQGMYMNPSAQGQAFLQNGQIIFRAAAPQDPNHQLMFSPNGQISSQQGQMQLQPQMNVSIGGNMQPVVSMVTTSAGVRPPANSMPMQPPPGKTAISRNLTPLLPTNTSRVTTPYMPQGLVPNQPSPKSKQKMSPRGSGAPIGRPPGPSKSALNSLGATSSSMSPPRLPGSPTPQSLGPPILQNSQGSLLPQQSQNIVYSQPPKLQPMLPFTTSSASVPSVPTLTDFNTSKATPAVSTPATTQNNSNNSFMKTLEKKENTESSSEVNGTSSLTAAETKPIGENGQTPKAVVKPNMLTHVIDGHVIMESSEPFPVDREDKGNVLRNRRKSEKDKNPGGPEKKRGPGRPPGSTRVNIEQQRLNGDGSNKGKLDIGPAPRKAKIEDGDSLVKPPPSSLTTSPGPLLKDNPLKWSVTQVCDFIKNLSGCSDYVEDFMLQEIDGQALMLLKADHLMSAMQIKLGPALKICSAVNALREELKQN